MTETAALPNKRPRLQPDTVDSQATLTDYIRTLRALNGHTGAVLARLLHIATSTYASKENNTRRLHIDEAAAILHSYGYTLAVIEIPQEGQ